MRKMEGVVIAPHGHVLSGGGESLVKYQSSISSLVSNPYLLAAFISFGVAQFLKLFTTRYKEKRWDMKKLVSSGGMPSSHSATVMGLVMAIGLTEGTGGSLFAIALVLANIVMYDAIGIRLQAGRQAQVLNQIVCELPPEHPVADTRPLREPLGHTPPQVLHRFFSSSFANDGHKFLYFDISHPVLFWGEIAKL